MAVVTLTTLIPWIFYIPVGYEGYITVRPRTNLGTVPVDAKR